MGEFRAVTTDETVSGHPSSAYRRVRSMLAEGRCVVLDGGVATEVDQIAATGGALSDDPLWGTAALLHQPDAVQAVHRRYAAIGCDVISTNTWGLTGAQEVEREPISPTAPPTHWMDVARRGIRTAREAIELEGRTDDVALAFSINGDVDSEQRMETLRLLGRVFEEDPPDLILLETATLIREELTFPTVESLLAAGLPLWLSFRRCRHGVCGVYGQHWGGPEGDVFGRAARRFEDLGVGALLLNCLPPDHITGMLPWLRDFTDLPLGVYPNLGYFTDDGWSFDRSVGPREYAELAASWRDEGAQIIGGCCGVRPEHIAAAGERVAETVPGGGRSSTGPGIGRRKRTALAPATTAEPEPAPWIDAHGRRLFPLTFPEIVCEPGVFVPTQGSFLVWKHLFANRIGAGARCVDIGCGTGLLSVQLALNGAEHVHAIDLERRAVDNTLANAFRNGVAERVTGATVDLYPWVPQEAYDLVVASLYQMPVDPFEQPSSHRPLDFWGRNLVDHLIALLPRLLRRGGVAYVMQLSLLGQQHTQSLLEGHGFSADVVDFSFFAFSLAFEQRAEQIRRVEELSDAYHLTFGEDDVMVAYLLEVRHRPDAPRKESRVS